MTVTRTTIIKIITIINTINRVQQIVNYRSLNTIVKFNSSTLKLTQPTLIIPRFIDATNTEAKEIIHILQFKYETKD